MRSKPGALGLGGLTLLIAAGVIGCAPQGETAKLKVGTVDVVRVLEERPETHKIKLEWQAKRGDAAMRMSAAKDQAEAEAIQKQIDQQSVAWQKRMDEFMGESKELIEKEATVLAKERGLDLVVVDNPLTRSVKYRDGEDLTLDVLVKLQNK